MTSQSTQTIESACPNCGKELNFNSSPTGYQYSDIGSGLRLCNVCKQGCGYAFNDSTPGARESEFGPCCNCGYEH